MTTAPPDFTAVTDPWRCWAKHPANRDRCGLRVDHDPAPHAVPSRERKTWRRWTIEHQWEQPVCSELLPWAAGQPAPSWG